MLGRALGELGRTLVGQLRQTAELLQAPRHQSFDLLESGAQLAAALELVARERRRARLAAAAVGRRGGDGVGDGGGHAQFELRHLDALLAAVERALQLVEARAQRRAVGVGLRRERQLRLEQRRQRGGQHGGERVDRRARAQRDDAELLPERPRRGERRGRRALGERHLRREFVGVPRFEGYGEWF